jgi:hypothetical protein
MGDLGRSYTADELRAMPTIATNGQYVLKADDGEWRIWISYVPVSGQPNSIKTEHLVDGKWQLTKVCLDYLPANWRLG